jgi:hypothetical protein
MESIEFSVLLELYARNIEKNLDYDPWNPIRINIDTIKELAKEREINMDIQNLKADLKDKGFIYEIPSEQEPLAQARYEFCYPKHFVELSQPENHSTKLTLFDVAICQHYGGPRDRTSFWDCLQRMWWMGPGIVVLYRVKSNVIDEKNLRVLSLAKKKPVSANCVWINNIKAWKELDGDWELSQDMGIGIFGVFLLSNNN